MSHGHLFGSTEGPHLSRTLHELCTKLRAQRGVGRTVRPPAPDGLGPPAAPTTNVRSVSSMQDKLQDLSARREAAYHAGSERSVERQHAKGKMLARERIEYFLDDGSFHELDLLARHRAHRGRSRGAPVHRRRHHRLGHRRRSQGVRVQPGLHRVRRCARRGVRREDPQADGPRPQDGRPAGRPQRRRRRPHPGGRGQPRQLRRHLPPQRAVVGRDPADLGDPRAVRRRRGLLARR